MITAPFNFVPLSKKVFFPYWAEQVSHDIPFSDGESGEIEITITAKSPIFIRNHEINSDKYYTNSKGDKVSTEFCNHKGEYYIPSTSIKGMTRNVLEIISFSRFKTNSANGTKTAVRDMTDTEKLVGQATGKTIDANFGYGILSIQDNTVEFEDYGNKIRLILQDDLIGSDDVNYTHDTKYYEDVALKYEDVAPFTQISVIEDENNNPGGNRHFDKYVVRPSRDSKKQGKLFFGGHFQGKHYEFVLLDEDKTSKQLSISDNVFKAFKKIYFENDDKENHIGRYWKERLDKIPVFYQKQGNSITHIGLTQVFKIEYNYSLNDAIQQDLIFSNNELIFDLSETIFGAIRKENSSVKGRVHFSHFKASNDAKPFSKAIQTILGSPKPTYYPEYIEQNCTEEGNVKNDKYNTLMEANSKIAGWKRYPVHKNWIPPIHKEGDSSTLLVPLGEFENGNFKEFSFYGKVRYHNLKKIELGALISALTFHDNQDMFYHSLGLGKALGFGKIKIDIDTSLYRESLQEFEYFMTKWTSKKLDSEWLATPQIKELFTMAYANLDIDRYLKYLILDPDNNINEFVDKKNKSLNREYKGRECLPKCSELFDMEDNLPKELIDQDVLNEIGEKILEFEKKQEEQEKRFIEEQKYMLDLNRARDTDNKQILENFIDEYSNKKECEEIRVKLNKIIEEENKTKFKELDAEVEKKWQNIHDPKYKNKLKSSLKSFIKTWSSEKNNKGSKFILDLVEKAKKEQK